MGGGIYGCTAQDMWSHKIFRTKKSYKNSLTPEWSFSLQESMIANDSAKNFYGHFSYLDVIILFLKFPYAKMV